MSNHDSWAAFERDPITCMKIMDENGRPLEVVGLKTVDPAKTGSTRDPYLAVTVRTHPTLMGRILNWLKRVMP